MPTRAIRMAGDSWLGMMRKITIARGLALGKFLQSMDERIHPMLPFFREEETFCTPKRLMGRGSRTIYGGQETAGCGTFAGNTGLVDSQVFGAWRHAWVRRRGVDS